MKRVLIVAPGRGSYDRSCLGQLEGRAPELLAACDQHRAANGRKTVSELDSAGAYRSSLHVAGENASLLTFACALADLHDLDRERFEVVGVVGNSMGFYTALAASGALSLPDAIDLVDTMGAYQARNVIGGQVLYPICDADWTSSDARRDAVDEALATTVAAGHVAEWSIDLGGYAVLGASKAGLPILMSALPPDQRGSRTFPIQLPLHSAFHTSLMADSSARALTDLAHLDFRAPVVPLFDGRGVTFRPGWASPDDLRSYTLGHQVTQPFDFTRGVKTALEFTAPDCVIALGPGNALGGPLARILVESHWRGIANRDDFAAQQDSDNPVLLSFGMADQRALLL